MMRTLPILLLACACLVQAGAQTNPPAPLPGEQFVADAKLPLADQVAPPLVSPELNLEFFRRGSGTLDVSRYWLLPQKTVTMSPIPNDGAIWQAGLPSFREQYPAWYASVRSSAGVWLIGASVELIVPGNLRVPGSLLLPRNAPEVAALPDGSILVAGGRPWASPFAQNAPEQRKIERVQYAGGGRIVSEAVGPLPPCTGNACQDGLNSFTMVSLGNGRVMLAGGSYYGRTTIIYDDAKRSWSKSGDMLQGHFLFTLTALPDGRVLAAGGNDTSGNNLDAGYITELWNPKTGKWSAGPPLPVLMQDHSALLLDNKTVVLAGGRVPVVLAWDIGSAQWRIAARHTLAHARGTPMEFGKDKLAIVGGTASHGYSIVNLAGTTERRGAPLGQILASSAFAARDGHILTAGGTFTDNFDGHTQSEPTAQVELYDARSDISRSLPALAGAHGVVQAAWVDEHRVLLMAENTNVAMPFDLRYLDTTSGAQQVLALPAASAETLFDRSHAGMKLVGVQAGRAWLVDPQAGVHWIDLASNTVSEGPRLQRKRANFTARVLANGTVVVAGGEVESELVLARVEDCPPCGEQYIGYGTPLPSRRHEIFNPITKQWSNSSPSRAAGGPVAILADGRVAKLGRFQEKAKNQEPGAAPAQTTHDKLMLELSDAEGKSWRNLPLPEEPGPLFESITGTLLATQDTNGLLGTTLFYGARDNKGQRHWWSLNVDTAADVWRDLGVAAATDNFVPGKVDSGMVGPTGKRIMLVGSDTGVSAFEE